MEQEIDIVVTDKDEILTINYIKVDPIDEIKYSPNYKFLVTLSKQDKSIAGWTVDPDKGTIQQDSQDNYFKYSEEHIMNVSDNKYILGDHSK